MAISPLVPAFAEKRGLRRSLQPQASLRSHEVISRSFLARDGGSWGGTDPPTVAYSYARGRGAIHALKVLEHYRSVVQCDGYAAYRPTRILPTQPGPALARSSKPANCTSLIRKSTS